MQELSLGHLLLVSSQVGLDGHVGDMLGEVVSEHLRVSKLALQVVWHWHPSHLCAALEHIEALLAHEVHKLLGVWNHHWVEPITAVAISLSRDVVSHVQELLGHLLDKAELLLVVLVCVGLGSVDDHGKDGGTWLLSELVDEVAIVSETSHPGDPGWLNLTTGGSDVLLDEVAGSVAHVDGPDQGGLLDLVPVVCGTVELVRVLESLHLFIERDIVGLVLLSSLSDHRDGTGSSGVVLDGSKTEHGESGLWVSSESVHRSETLGAILENLDVGTLQSLGDIGAVIGHTVDIGNDHGLGLGGDGPLDVLNGWLEGTE